MGLGTVQLVDAIEQRFSITISDQEVEHIYTLQDMTNCVARHLRLGNNTQQLKEQVMQKFHEAREAMGTAGLLLSGDLVFRHYPVHNRTFWAGIEKQLGLKIPFPKSDFVNRILNLSRSSLREAITLDAFLDALCIYNCPLLVTADRPPSSLYEIYLFIGWLTWEIAGVDVYEMRPSASFIDDIGMS